MDSSPSRRSFVAAAAALGVAPAKAQAPLKVSGPRFAVSSYSYWHFRGERYPIERVIDQAAALGFDGVEILHRQMSDESPEALANLKRAALLRGVALVMFSIHQDFVSPWADERGQAIRHTQYGIGLAEKLGCPGVRINSGRWRTIRLFDDLMKVKGDEPPIPGYTEKDAVQWCISSIRACLPAAEKAGVMLMLENHWGVTMKAENLLHIVEQVNSPWLGVNLDIGNFPGDPYPEIEKLAPHAAYVHFKTYFGGGEYYTLNLNYKRIAGILKQAGFRGYVSLEMEGKEAPESAVAKSLDLMRKRLCLIMLRCERLSKTYLSAAKPLIIFDGLDLAVAKGERVAIVGESGSGKSTLLHLLGGLDRPTAGSILFEGSDIGQYSTAQLADYRNRRVGFVWQIHHLLPEFTAAENVAMPLLIQGQSRREAHEKALRQLGRVGLSDRAHHRSGELSGGEQQRVVLARALAGEPALLLADEPTGNLDTGTGERIFGLLDELHASSRLTTVLVTHSRQFAARCDRVLLLHNGTLLPA